MIFVSKLFFIFTIVANIKIYSGKYVLDMQKKLVRMILFYF